jgi:hypothetical protein
MKVNDKIINSLLENELNADARAVDVAVITVHATPRVVPVKADTPGVRKMAGSGQTAEELSGRFASLPRRTRLGGDLDSAADLFNNGRPSAFPNSMARARGARRRSS